MDNQKRLGDQPVEPNPELFVGYIKQTLFEALRRGGEWGTPELIDEVLDLINDFGKPKVVK